MEPAHIASLCCPVCRSDLSALPATPATLGCATGHRFDVARHGYVDLTAGRVTHAGDTPAMIAARDTVLRAGHFDFLTEAVGRTLTPYPRGMVVDVGAGTGHHLAALLGRWPDAHGLALDVSKAALRRAARAHPRLAAVRADAWRGLPVRDGAAAAVVNIFAPRQAREFVRVLGPHAPLVVVTPTAGHLRELDLTVRVDPDKDARLAATLAGHFTHVRDEYVTATLALSAAEAAAVVAMGPDARHTSPRDTVSISVTAAVRISVWRR